ncbi:phage minor head protein [Cognaticolwellia mytili]|uniref:phage minor head protein n=1 Tax=Cognaticolwellia mytili TaxID=1888913 RepID=UPI000A173092|nr:phage minor head protein [Cognaticolwellia mytili]
MPEARYGSLPFQESIDFFKNKLNIPTERWNDVWRDGHNSGFMVAGALKDDLLNDFRQAVDRAIAEGKSISWFQKEFKNITAKHGWSHTGDANWRSNIIYNTNMRQAYNAGRFEQLQNFPFWEYQHGDSRQPRALHLSWHTLVLPKDDPWWQTHFPSNGWGCKCRVRGRSARYLKRKGITVDKAPNNGIWEWTDKATGEVHKIPKGIDPSFDYAPRKSTVVKQQKQLAKKKAPVHVPPERIAPTAFSTVRGADIHGLNSVLAELKNTAAAPEVEKLRLFLDKHQTKTLFLQQKEMNPRAVAATKVKDDIEHYLGKHARLHTLQLYTDNQYRIADGYTSRSFNHVVMKAQGVFSKAVSNEIKQAISAAITLNKAGKSAYTFSEVLKTFGDGGANSSMVSDWIHEIGHQIHYKAGMPYRPRIKMGENNTITRYAKENNFEWHAEMFVAWLLDRKALAAWNDDIAQYMDNLVNKAINND